MAGLAVEESVYVPQVSVGRIVGKVSWYRCILELLMFN